MDKEPLVSVVRGEPADDELAALVVLLTARSTMVDADVTRPALSAWARSARPASRAASWRASALPR